MEPLSAQALGGRASTALRIALIAVALIVLAPPRHAVAGFVNGVERFNGTFLDTNTWIAAELNGTISQDDELQLASLGYMYVDYTTIDATVGVGDVVSVELHSIDIAVAALFLTTNSEGTTQSCLFDSKTLSIRYNASFNNFTGANGEGSLHHGSIFGFDTPPPQPGSPYILQIERTSSTTATYSAFEADGTLIGSVERTFADVPDELFIALITYTGSLTLPSTAVFDDVSAPIPNASVPALSGPGTLALVAAMLLSACQRLSRRE